MQQTAQNDNYVSTDNAPDILPRPQERDAQLTALKNVIRKLEYSTVTELEDTACHTAASTSEIISFPEGHCHEVWAASPSDYGAAMGFAIRAITATDKPILWVTSRSMSREHGLPYGAGLLQLGIAPSKLILVRCAHETEALWAMEEGLKTTALAAVMGELTDIDLKSSRRLSLACREHGSRAILLLRRTEAASSACYSRWQLTPYASSKNHRLPHIPGATRMEASLVKHRAGRRPASKIMEWQDAPDRFSMAPSLADRTLDARGTPKRHTG